jgi:hypothetical protein
VSVSEASRKGEAMTMPPRLTEEAQYPLDRFDRCQLCGRIYTEVCSLHMWYECDENDQPESPPRVLLICRGEEDYDEGRE